MENEDYIIPSDDEDGAGAEAFKVVKTIELGEGQDEGDVSSDEEVVEMGQGVEVEELVSKPKELSPCSVEFRAHKGSVFSLGVCPKGEMVVSGGEDDRGLLWRSVDGEVVYECGNHKDSVVSCGFSYDGKYVCCADMSGQINVLKAKTGELVWNFETADIEWTQWHPTAHVLLAGCADGMTWMWKVPSGQYKTFPAHGVSNTCGRIAGDLLLTGYKDGALKIWDLKQGLIQHHIKKGMGAHSDGVTSLDVIPSGNLAASGSEDGTCHLSSLHAGKTVETIRFGSEAAPDGVESVALGATMLACGTLGGSVGVWDLREQKMRHLLSAGAGVVHLKWFPTPYNILCCTLDGSVQLWDTRGGEVVRNWNAHSDQVLALDVIEQKNAFVTGSADQTARVFTLQ